MTLMTLTSDIHRHPQTGLAREQRLPRESPQDVLGRPDGDGKVSGLDERRPARISRRIGWPRTQRRLREYPWHGEIDRWSGTSSVARATLLGMPVCGLPWAPTPARRNSD